MYSKEQPRKGFGGSAKGGGGYESSQSDLDLTSGSDSDSSAAVGAYHSHHRQGNGVSSQEQNVPQQQHHHNQQQYVEETVEVVRREPKMRGNRVRPGLPQIQERKKVSIDDFQLIKVLGRGCMGKVATFFVYYCVWRRSCNVYVTSNLNACSLPLTIISVLLQKGYAGARTQVQKTLCP